MSPRHHARASVERRPATRGRRRALGQHFLRDESVARRIIGLVRPTRADLVVEIGPGKGALTEALASASGRLLALEVDAALAARLRARFAHRAEVEIRDIDARVLDYSHLRDARPDATGRVLVVGNLPYSVAKPILMRLVEAGRAVDEMALMLQKEVAERLAAPPGTKVYGSLSVLTQIACDVELSFAVPPGAFTPPPRVDSAVVHVRTRPTPAVPVADLRRFRGVVRAAFGQRRKSLANALAAGLGITVEQARVIVAETGIDACRRAETLSLAEFAALTDAVIRSRHGSTDDSGPAS